MAQRLRLKKIDRVDLVDDGANQHAHVMLFKRHINEDEGNMSDEKLNDINKRLDDITKANEAITKANETLTAENAELKKSLAETKAAQEAADAKAQQTEAQLTAMREANEKAEAEQLAKSLGIPDKAGLLQVAKRSLPEAEYTALVETFKANKAAVDAAVGIEKGHSGDSPAASTADAEVRKRAEALVSEGKAKTYDEAVVAVAEADPGLIAKRNKELYG